jgi:hypothetical protein
MTWQLYELDKAAHDLVLQFRDSDILSESHKMRATTAFGLERFWGEHLRLQQRERDKAEFWKATWDQLCQIMKEAGITIPNQPVRANDTQSIQAMSEQLWSFDQEQRKVALAVLIQLCDSMVWWTQRYKLPRGRRS